MVNMATEGVRCFYRLAMVVLCYRVKRDAYKKAIADNLNPRQSPSRYTYFESLHPLNHRIHWHPTGFNGTNGTNGASDRARPTTEG